MSAISLMLTEQITRAFGTWKNHPYNEKMVQDVEKEIRKVDHCRQFEVNVELDNGQKVHFNGFRVQHSSCLGPYKGGIRFHPQVDMDESTALATWMTLKTAVLGIPLGGGKGGLAFDPNAYSKTNQERITRAFGACLAPFIGEEIDIPAPDVGTNSATMAMLLEEYQSFHHLKSDEQIGVFTGKAIDKGGSRWRTEATGYGVALATRVMLTGSAQGDVSGLTFSIQGLGNVGRHVARFLTEWGMVVVAVADHTGCRSFLDSTHTLDFSQKETLNLVESWKEGKEIDEFSFFQVECDVFIPAALEMVIDESTAKLLKCSMVVEAANGPTTPQGEAVLRERKITVVPDILANSGGVLVSYYEWLQNREHNSPQWSDQKVRESMVEHLLPIFHELYQHHQFGQTNILPERDFCFHRAFNQIAKCGLLTPL